MALLLCVWRYKKYGPSGAEAFVNILRKKGEKGLTLRASQHADRLAGPTVFAPPPPPLNSVGQRADQHAGPRVPGHSPAAGAGCHHSHQGGHVGGGRGGRVGCVHIWRGEGVKGGPVLQCVVGLCSVPRV